MNEERAILDFFSQTENLSVALSVAEQVDTIREQMNNRLWQELLSRLNGLIKEHGLAWHAALTEDRNSPEGLVGLHCTSPTDEQPCLRPMLEQQYLGGEWRIYFGLIWSANPSPAQLRLAQVSSLKTSLLKAGFKNNESFLAWKWTAFHPRGKHFLLGYAHQPEKIIDDVVQVFTTLLIDQRVAIQQANESLKTSQARNLSASLNQLRDELLE